MYVASNFWFSFAEAHLLDMYVASRACTSSFLSLSPFVIKHIVDKTSFKAICLDLILDYELKNMSKNIQQAHVKCILKNL